MNTALNLSSLLLEAVAQSSSESKSEAIKWGINKGFQSGASRLYSRKCYGYTNDENNDLIIDEEQASNVRLIYDLYLRGYSLIAIIRELERQNIKSPTGKVKWSNRAIETVLSNEKYIGRVIVGKTYGDDYPKNKRYINRGERERYLAKNTHEPIISNEVFEQVQSQRSRRSNIEIDADGTVKRRSTYYSVKKNNV